MKALKIFQVTIKKWIFIVPFDLKCDSQPILKCADVIHFMGLTLARNAVYPALNDEVSLDPSLISQRTSKALCASRLTTSTGDDLVDGNHRTCEGALQLRYGLREVDAHDRLSVRNKLNLKACVA